MDEANLEGLSGRQLFRLMQLSRIPAQEEMVGTSWNCSFYLGANSRASNRIDRDVAMLFYQDQDGLLLSFSNLSRGEPARWMFTPLGMEASGSINRDYRDTCIADARVSLVVRKTPAGNLIFESAVHRSALVSLCGGEDRAAQYIAPWAQQVSAIGSDNRIGTTFAVCAPATGSSQGLPRQEVRQLSHMVDRH